MDACTFVLLRQVFEAEKMTTKRGCYHKKCFACIKCKANLNYSNAIEGPDDEVNKNIWVIHNQQNFDSLLFSYIL